ncbi:MAG: eukaryotic-like serine/threonine-protein kinase [Thermomicrobiales bacterium]|nr:eukaryotic-like serine/threonine-protein kinase [Thermomicrobiales bacterium]
MPSHGACSRRSGPHSPGPGLLIVLAVALLIASPGPHAAQAQPDDWADSDESVTMLRGSAARTGVHPGPGPTSSPKHVWSVHLGDLIVSSPVVADELVYIGSVSPTIAAGGALHALDLLTGVEIWRVDLDRGDGILSTPAVANGVVYVATYDGVVLAIDATTGEEVWRSTLDEPIYYSSPAVEDGVLYVGDIGGRLYALDTEDGRREWEFAVGEGNERSMGTPAVADGRVYVVAPSARRNEQSELFALDAETGEEHWSFVAEDVGEVRGTPAIADGRVYVPTTLGSVYALSARDGSVDWRFDSEREISATSTVVVDDEVIVGTDDGALHAVDAETGERTRNLPDMTGGGFLTSPTVADGVVYSVDTGGALYAVDLDAEKELWTVDTASLGSSPAIIDGLVVIGDEFGFLVAFG